jgi:competence protein ComEA
MHPAVFCFLLAIPLLAQSELPEGPGQADVKKVCGGCHSFTLITQNRYTKERWDAVVENMVSRGAEGSDEELDRVVQYLVQHFGPVTGKVNVNTATAEDIAKVLAISQETSAAVVQYRAKHGNFRSLEDLKSVPGMDSKAIEEKKDRIEF